MAWMGLLALCIGACATAPVAPPKPAPRPGVIAHRPVILRDSRQTLLADTVLVAKPVVEPKEEPRPAPEPQLIDAKIETLSLCESTESNPDGGRCLWVEPKAPQPGDLVMFETDASAWIGAATLSAFGRDVRMFRVGDRWRGFVAVPFNAEPSAFQTRLTLTSNADPDSRSYRCLDALVSERAFGVGGQLKVARKFTKRAAAVAAQHGRTSEGNASWVDALEVPTFSPQLFVWPRPGEVTSRFGLSRSYNKKFSTRHMGVDIEGTVGDRVFATQAGVVRYSGKERSTGHTVVIDHGGGILSIYMHLSQRLKHAGDKVMQGELVAYVGRTGRVTGPHLHFAMTVHGRFVDPEQVLSHPLYATAPGLPCRVEPSSHSVR